MTCSDCGRLMEERQERFRWVCVCGNRREAHPKLEVAVPSETGR